jgi:plastocyanin domain-containing protein
MRMTTRALVVCMLVASLGACERSTKDTATNPPAPAPTATAPAPGVAPAPAGGARKIEITADAEGYTPSRIVGKPGEKLALVFTRKIEADCLAQLKTPSGALVDLPLGKPVEVAVTVPASGELGFACGMDMFHGVIVAQPTGS